MKKMTFAQPTECAQLYSLLHRSSRICPYRQRQGKCRKVNQDKGHSAAVLATIDAVRERNPLPTSFETSVDSTVATLEAIDSLAGGMALAC